MSSKGVAFMEWLELQRIVSLQEAARLAGCSQDTLRRNHRDKIVKVSDRRQGMRIKDALMLSTETS
jgi:hypothetical protein